MDTPSLIGHLAWPAVALLGMLLYRRPIAQLLEWVAQRIRDR